MKFLKLFLVMIFMLLFCTAASAVDLAWDANSETDLKGYTLYFHEKSDPSVVHNTAPVIAPATTVTIDDSHFTPGVTYTFYVTAYNADMESGPSISVDWTAPSYKPPGVNLPALHVPKSPGNPANMLVL